MVKTSVFNDENSNSCSEVGETITYTFTVTNTGEIPLTDVVLSDPLLAAPNPVVAITFTGGDTNGDQALDPDETWTYTADYVLTQADVDAGLVENQATVMANSCVQYSDLWGENGESWDEETSILRNFSNVGYMSGDVPIPNWPVGVNVTDFGATPNDGIDDSQAFIDALAACPDNHAVLVPLGTYTIKQKIEINRNNVVLRGEDMYETILRIPYYLTELYPGPGNPGASGAFIDVEEHSQVGIEHLSFEFREQMKGNHWEFRGADAIEYHQVQDSWVRNVYIKNADHAITIRGNNSTHVSVINIKLDQYIGRPDISPNLGDWLFGWVGHVGIGLADCSYILVHEVEFTGRWFHDFDILSPNHTVISRIKGSDFSYNRHSQGGQYNLYTEGNTGRGTRTISGDLTPSNETYWNIVADRDITARYTDPAQSTGNIFVAVPTSEPERKINDFWIEHLDQNCTYPQNLYLAQLEYFGKPLPEGPPPPIPSPYEEDVVQITPTDDNIVTSGDEVSSPEARSLNLTNVYMKFDLTPLQLAGVARARLKVRAGNIANTPITIAAYSVEDDSWTQETITYNNRPTSVAQLTTLDITEDSEGRWFEFDVTNFVRNQWNSDQVVSLQLLKTAGIGTNSRIHSREQGSGPRLIIEQTQVLPTPVAPTGLQTTSQEGFVELDWDQHPDSANITYTIYRREDGESYGYPIATGITESDFNDVDYFVENKESSDLPGGVTFYYVITAVNKAFGESAPSAEQTGSSLDTTPPDAPDRLAATPGHQQVDLSWRDNRTVDFASYSVFRSQTSGSYDFSMPLVSGLTGTSYTDTDVTNETTYYYVITELDLAGNESGPSLENSATPSANVVALYNFNNSSSVSQSSHPHTTSSDLTEGGGLMTKYEIRAFGVRGMPIPALTWKNEDVNDGVILDDDYLSFTVTADAGSLNFDKLQIDTKGADLYLFSDQTGFTDINDTIARISDPGDEFVRHSISLTGMTPAAVSTTTEFRLYSISSTNTSGPIVDNIILYAESVGASAAAPEAPTSIMSIAHDQRTASTHSRTPLGRAQATSDYAHPFDCQADHAAGHLDPSGTAAPTNVQAEQIKTVTTLPNQPRTLSVQNTVVSDLSGTAPDNDTPTQTDICTLPIFVQQITLSVASAEGGAYQGHAVVLVHDGNGNPVPNAQVAATFSGIFVGALMATTDTNGEATFLSTNSENTTCFDFTLCVNDVSHSAMDYESNLNLVTCEAVNACLCQDTDILLGATTVTQDTQHWVEQTITSAETLTTGTTISYQAGTSISLQPGFHAQPGATFSAKIVDCIIPLPPAAQMSRTELPEQMVAPMKQGDQTELRIFPNPFLSRVQVEVYLPESGQASMYIMDLSGRLVHQLAEGTYDAGLHRLSWTPEQLTGGIYLVRLVYNDQVTTRKVVYLR